MSDAGGSLEARLGALRDAGAASWDPAGVHVLERLLQTALGSEPALAAHLHTRAAAHLSALEQAFAAARARATLGVEQLAQTGPAAASVRSALREMLDSGAFGQVQRKLRRAARAHSELRSEVKARQQARLQNAAQRRGLVHASSSEQPAAALAAALYRDSAAGARVRRTLARAVAGVPIDAGHYNAQRVAAQTLQLLGAYPAYLRAQLARLETVALLPAPAEAKPTRSRRKQRTSARS